MNACFVEWTTSLVVKMASRSQCRYVENRNEDALEIYSLSILSVVTLIALISITLAVSKGNIAQETYFWLLGLIILLGMYTVGALVERLIVHLFSAFQVSKLLWAALVAIGLFVGRKTGIGDVNAVFHIDAAALPMTTTAASAIALFAMMWWPFIIICATSGLILAISIIATLREKRGYGLAISLSAFLTVICGLSALLITKQLDEEGRHQKIYRIAHATDFSAKFHCKGVDQERYSVLFIGPDQKKVLIAPLISQPSIFLTKRANVLDKVDIPSAFPVKECVPSIEFDDWERERQGHYGLSAPFPVPTSQP